MKLYGICLSPFVRKVRYVLHHKKIEYSQEMATPMSLPDGYHEISPLGKIPALVDDGLNLPDSSVIVQYLERKVASPSLFPGDATSYAKALWFEEYADSGLSPVIGGKIFFPRCVHPKFLDTPTDEAVVAEGEASLQPMFDYLDQQLQSGLFFVENQLTIADISIFSILVNYHHAGFNIDAQRWPTLAKFYEYHSNQPIALQLIAEDRQVLSS